MPSPLPERSYELLLRIASVTVEAGANERTKQIATQLFTSALDLSIALESASAAPNRIAFRQFLSDAHASLKHVKLWLRLLDDLGRIEPEAAHPLGTLAEEVHRILLSALRKSSQLNGTVNQGA